MSLMTICFLFLASVDLGFGRFLAFWFWTISEVCDLFDVFVLFCLLKICLVTFFCATVLALGADACDAKNVVCLGLFVVLGPCTPRKTPSKHTAHSRSTR